MISMRARPLLAPTIEGLLVQSGRIRRYEGATGKALGELPRARNTGYEDVTVALDGSLWAVSQEDVVHLSRDGARHPARPGLVLFDSFHCSRYNTNTGKLTTEMFEAVFAQAHAILQ